MEYGPEIKPGVDLTAREKRFNLDNSLEKIGNVVGLTIGEGPVDVTGYEEFLLDSQTTDPSTEPL